MVSKGKQKQGLAYLGKQAPVYSYLIVFLV